MGNLQTVTQVCPEYAREYITRLGFPEHPAVQAFIFNKQLRREDMLSHSSDWLFCDSPLFFTYLYALYILDPASDQQRKIVKELYRWSVLDTLDRYEKILFLPRQFDIVDDGVRHPDHTNRLEKLIMGFVDLHSHMWKDKFVVLESKETDPKAILKDRVRMVEELLVGRTEPVTDAELLTA